MHRILGRTGPSAPDSSHPQPAQHVHTTRGLGAGHAFWEIRDVQLIPVAVAAGGGREAAAQEARYRRLLITGMELSRNFALAYTYDLCATLQANVTQPLADPFASRFVWNEYLTRDFRSLVRFTSGAVMPLLPVGCRCWGMLYMLGSRTRGGTRAGCSVASQISHGVSLLRGHSHSYSEQAGGSSGRTVAKRHAISASIKPAGACNQLALTA